ncbi:hypothetical protein ACIQVA_33005 [Streptomyces microflavus]|uniref:hypothetical protein n=1 Tax=Streptomyces microflavus TaxID=1919 RepID=UPI003805F791
MGNALASWFGAAFAHPLDGWLQEKTRGTAFFSASTRADGRAASREFHPLATEWEAMRGELPREPETAHLLFMREYLGKPLVHVRSSAVRVRRPNAEAQLLFGADRGGLDDPAFCSSTVEFLVAALDMVNPAFAWLGADAPASEETNLDWVLGRRVRDSVNCVTYRKTRPARRASAVTGTVRRIGSGRGRGRETRIGPRDFGFGGPKSLAAALPTATGSPGRNVREPG